MILSPCSAAERAYVQLGVAQGVRNDGRDTMDSRPVTVDAGVLPNANGSARVTLGKGLIGGSGGTDVIAAIKAEVRTPVCAIGLPRLVAYRARISSKCQGLDYCLFL